LASYYFSTRIVVPGIVTGGTIAVASDDYARVMVNGRVVGTTGSVTDFHVAALAQRSLRTFSLKRFLKPGANVITVHAQNGPRAFAATCSATCTYAENPAGVVFGGTISYTHG
jgi:hypothetical protein